MEIATIRLANGARSTIGWTRHALNNLLRMARPIFGAGVAGFYRPDAREGLDWHKEQRRTNFNPVSVL